MVIFVLTLVYAPCKHVFSLGLTVLEKYMFTGGTYSGQYKNNHVIIYNYIRSVYCQCHVD